MDRIKKNFGFGYMRLPLLENGEVDTKQISIPDLFSCMNAKMVFYDWNADYYYNNVHTARNGKASECVKCGKCEKVCPQHLKIREILEDVAKEFEKPQQTEE